MATSNAAVPLLTVTGGPNEVLERRVWWRTRGTKTLEF
jgi:hypothetical protein